MADVGTVLTDALTGDATVNALVSGRVGPHPLPQAPTVPAVTYRRIGGAPIAGMVTNTGLATPLYRLTCWARTYEDAQALADAVEDALDRWETAGPPVILDAIQEDRADDYEDDTRLHRVDLDFELWHRS